MTVQITTLQLTDYQKRLDLRAFCVFWVIKCQRTQKRPSLRLYSGRITTKTGVSTPLSHHGGKGTATHRRAHLFLPHTTSPSCFILYNRTKPITMPIMAAIHTNPKKSIIVIVLILLAFHYLSCKTHIQRRPAGQMLQYP